MSLCDELGGDVMRWSVWGLLSGCTVLVACETTPPPKGDVGPPAITTPSLKIAADDRSRLGGPGSNRFRISELRNLQFRLQVPELPAGVTWVTLRLYTPNGALYHTRHTPFSTDPTLKQVPSPDGVPHPIDVIQAVAIPGGLGLDEEILVGGTNINRHPLPGAWKVSIERDDQPTVRAETTFELGMGQ